MFMIHRKGITTPTVIAVNDAQFDDIRDRDYVIQEVDDWEDEYPWLFDYQNMRMPFYQPGEYAVSVNVEAVVFVNVE